MSSSPNRRSRRSTRTRAAVNYNESPSDVYDSASKHSKRRQYTRNRRLPIPPVDDNSDDNLIRNCRRQLLPVDNDGDDNLDLCRVRLEHVFTGDDDGAEIVDDVMSLDATILALGSDPSFVPRFKFSETDEVVCAGEKFVRKI